MNRLELGRHWVAHLCAAMPDESQRLCIRMGWHLAAQGIRSDEELGALPNLALNGQTRGSPHFPRLRLLYLQRISDPAQIPLTHSPTSNVIAFGRGPNGHTEEVEL